MGSGDGSKLRTILERADEQLEHIHKPREEAVDAEIFSLITEGGVELVKRLAKGGKQATPIDLVRSLKAKFVDDADAQAVGAQNARAFDWAKVSKTRVSPWFVPAPVCYHMLGPMDAVPKAKRTVAQRKRREPLGAAVRPDELADDEIGERQETDRNMEVMWEVLRHQESCSADMLELIFNHRSFSQTVENAFALSFLVKDGRVALKHCPNGTGIRVERLLSKAKGDRERSAEEGRVQFITALDTDTWELWKTVIDPAATLMPHRAPVTDETLAAEEAEAATQTHAAGKRPRR